MDATVDGVLVPSQFVEEGRIVLNIAPGAVRQLELGNKMISFSARFSGSPMNVMVPPLGGTGYLCKREQAGHAVLEQGPSEKTPPDDGFDPSPPRDRPTLKTDQIGQNRTEVLRERQSGERALGRVVLNSTMRVFRRRYLMFGLLFRLQGKR